MNLPQQAKSQRTHTTEDRRNAHDRGYDFEWKEFRAKFLRYYGLCVGVDPTWTSRVPKPGSHIHAANEVHHIKKVSEHPELKCIESNCIPLCKQCHSIRTRRGE